jgi:hypothetical protein
MRANAGDYSAAEKCLLPETQTALNSKIGAQLIWDGITKKGTVKNIAVLKEHIRGEGATVRISIAYEDGTSSQVEEMLRKVDGKWNVSLMGLVQTSISTRFTAGQNPSGYAGPEPFKSITPQQVSAASNQKQEIHGRTVTKKPAAPEPTVQRRDDEHKLAMEKLDEFQRAGDDETRWRIAKELAEMSGKWTKEESSQVIEGVVKLGAAGKPLARLLCEIIANGPITPYSVQADPVRRRALAALESVNPDLYQPIVVITIDRSASSHSNSLATEKLAELGDASVAPILLKHLRDAVKKAAGAGPFSYFGETPRYMETLAKISPDDPSTFQAIFAIAKTCADPGPQKYRGAHNFSSDNLPVAVAAVKILGRFGPKAKEAVPMLTHLKLDESESMRKAATEALTQIQAKE